MACIGLEPHGNGHLVNLYWPVTAAAQCLSALQEIRIHTV